MRALVLRKLPFGESDAIVHFLLEDGRRVSGFAPGARRSKKRFPHQFHFAGLFHVETHREFQENKMTRLHSCDLLHFEAKLSENMESLSRWMMVLEWIQSDESVHFDFEEVLSVMKALAEGNYLFFHRFFLLQMKRHGLFPKLDACVICDKELTGILKFSLAEGGAVHAICGSGMKLDLAALHFMRESLEDSADSVSEGRSQNLNSHQIHQLDGLTVPFLEHQLGRNLKSRRFFLQLAAPTEKHPEARFQIAESEMKERAEAQAVLPSF
jgi:DNA repair protein RecO (recombination protein O)